MHVREQAISNRETRIREREKITREHDVAVTAREMVTREHDVAVTEREKAVQLREEALRALGEVEAARLAREQLMIQLRDANERLVAATLRADELLEQAVAAGAIARESAVVEAEGRRRAEALAAELRASEELLRASERKALANNRAKDEFLAMLGHELRSPLAPMLLALDLIAMDTTDAHKREHTIIERQVKLIVQLVDDLLDVSRSMSGKIELRRQPIELADVVSRAVEIASPLIEAKGHVLTIEIPERGLTVDGDVLRLTQVVANLLTNAAKYTPPKGAIAVLGERRGASALLRVRDTGIGISKQMLPRIFDLFAQEHQPADRAPGGLGLGLSIVRSLVTLHGGTVTANSEGLGHGSELVLELPRLLLGSETAASKTASPVSAAAIEPRKILVVDDNRTVADLTSIALTRLGYDVRVAFDGTSALSSVKDFVPEVVLLDIGLPGIDGYEVAKRLRAALAPHEPRFIATSGYGQAADRQRSADANFDDHLVKPVDLATLQRSIERSRPKGKPSEIEHDAR
jgi:signal transduction histidine kinase/ActR/RegA family two-component response regulator